MGANGYVEDVRFNRPAKDGDQYTDEGIYTFKVKNLYTGESTIKKIYVGDTGYMRALSLNKITVSDLNYRMSQGGTIENDGTITMPPPPTEPETAETGSEVIEETKQDSNTVEDTNSKEPIQEQKEAPEKADATSGDNTGKGMPVLPIVLVGLVAAGGAGVVHSFKKNNEKQ